MWRGLSPTWRNPSCLPALRHVGRRWGRSKKLRIAWAKSRNACCWTVCDPAASHSYSARAAVNWAHCCRNRAPGGPAASAAAARRQDSTQTGHGDSVRPMPPPAQSWEATETCTQQQDKQDHRQPVGRRYAALPPPARPEDFHATKLMNVTVTGHQRAGHRAAHLRQRGLRRGRILADRPGQQHRGGQRPPRRPSRSLHPARPSTGCRFSCRALNWASRSPPW